MKINIKPLSINEAIRTVNGRMIKSANYRAYEKELFYKLPNNNIPPGKLEVYIKVGLSSKLSDVDNIAKPFIDVLQKKYIFNDRMIYKLNLEKEDVEKGEEYITFNIISKT